MNPPDTTTPATHKSLSRLLMQRARARLLAGLVVVVPIAVTVFVASFAYGLLEQIVGPIVEGIYDLPIWKTLLGREVTPWPAFKLICTILIGFSLLYFFGFISTFILTRQLYALGERLLMKIPFVKSIYGLSKQAIDLVMHEDRNAFKQLVLVEYPRKGVYAMAFVTGETRLEPGGCECVNVFLPTTPNPTSGFMLILPREQVLVVNMTIEDGIKLIMSGGVITPAAIHCPVDMTSVALSPDELEPLPEGPATPPPTA